MKIVKNLFSLLFLTLVMASCFESEQENVVDPINEEETKLFKFTKWNSKGNSLQDFIPPFGNESNIGGDGFSNWNSPYSYFFFLDENKEFNRAKSLDVDKNYELAILISAHMDYSFTKMVGQKYEYKFIIDNGGHKPEFWLLDFPLEDLQNQNNTFEVKVYGESLYSDYYIMIVEPFTVNLN